jgi:hypothetical protein
MRRAALFLPPLQNFFLLGEKTITEFLRLFHRKNANNN